MGPLHKGAVLYLGLKKGLQALNLWFPLGTWTSPLMTGFRVWEARLLKFESLKILFDRQGLIDKDTGIDTEM